MDIAKDRNRPKPDHIAEGIDASKRPAPVTAEEGRGEEASLVPVAQLAAGEAGELADVVRGERCEFGHQRERVRPIGGCRSMWARGSGVQAGGQFYRGTNFRRGGISPLFATTWTGGTRSARR